MMFDRNKNKTKIQYGKALQTVSNIVRPSSDVRELLDSAHKDLSSQKSEKIHETLIDTEVGKEFIISQFSKEPKSLNYRSPYSNRYYPTHKEDMYMLPPLLRDIEEKGNFLFSQYVRLYYGEEGCVSNFYVFETEQGTNFAFYIKKNHKEGTTSGIWSSTNIVEIRGDPSKSVSYKVQTTVLYELNLLNQQGEVQTEFFGSIKKSRVESKRCTPDEDITEFHLSMTGRLIEQIQTYLRQQIESVFALKTREIVFKTRFINTKEEEEEKKKRGKEMIKIRGQSAKIIDK